jgi:hypothetical protein
MEEIPHSLTVQSHLLEPHPYYHHHPNKNQLLIDFKKNQKSKIL